jgi:hypothetical protein
MHRSVSRLRTCFKIGGASGAFMDQAGRSGTSKRVPVARVRRSGAIQRRVHGCIPGVPIFLKHVLREISKRKRAALLAVGALATAGAFVLPAVPASAEYYWGCTYSYGNACFSHHPEGINYLITMDPDKAGYSFGWGGITNNGYPGPKYDGRERCVGSAIWDNGQVVPWVAAWGRVIVTYPEAHWGEGMIGTCVEYYEIALYQMVDYSEYG